MGVVTNAMLFLKGRTMKTRKNLTHNHEVSAAGTVTAYDGWRECVSITIRDEGKEGQDEISIELPNNVFDKLVEKVNLIVEEREASKMEESEVE
jgi:hypothetical protein